MNAPITLPERDRIIIALRAWIRQRPGLEFGNYGDVSSYRSEMRSITRDLRDARTLLDYVEARPDITADMLREAFRSAYSGRLSWDAERGALNYCTGQYWPTEYRRAACAVLASAIWYYWRADITADRAKDHASVLYRHKSIGDALRAYGRRQFGASIQRRWFN